MADIGRRKRVGVIGSGWYGKCDLFRLLQVASVGVAMLDVVRWMLELGWPESISSSGGIFMDKESRANITDA